MKTIVGLFDTFEEAKNAGLDLERAGIANNDISIVANNDNSQYAVNSTDGVATETTVTGHAIGHDAKVGAEWGAGIGFLIGITGFAIPGLGWIATAGWLGGTLLGAATGAVVGGLVGALTSVGVPEEEAYHYNEAVRRGGILLAVRAQEEQAQRVAEILGQDGAVNIDERVEQYRREGYVPGSLNTTPAYNTPVTAAEHTARDMAADVSNSVQNTEGRIPGIQTGGHAVDGSGAPDTRGIMEKTADTLTGDRIDDKTGRPV